MIDNEFDKMKKSRDVRPFKPKEDRLPYLLYQYRDFGSFWNIIQSDCFWATDARFSNDNEERQIGIQFGNKMFNNKQVFDDLDEEKDHYIVCFCSENDKLSQWRGYAPNGGVSIGFAFNSQFPFTSFVKKDNVEYSASFYSNVISVFYIELGRNEEEYENDINDALNFESRDVSEQDRELEKAVRYKTMIPYIKHIGFEEEKEWRIVVNEDDIERDQISDFRECISYRLSGNKYIPFIRIRPGLVEYDKNVCSVRLRIEDKDNIEWTKDLEEYLNEKLNKGEFNLYNCVKDDESTTTYDDKYCFGCTRRAWYIPRSLIDAQVKCKYNHDELVLRCNEPNNIIISQGKKQKEIFEAVHAWAAEKNRIIFNKNSEGKIRVWCEGHLPIREIYVGPCENMMEMKESISNFCKNSDLYWLRDVEIKTSSIPYRTPVSG